MTLLQSKTIVLGVTGSIAAYKAIEVARLFVKAGAQVHVIMTDAATKFVSTLTFQAITHQKVSTSIFDPESALGIDHISLAKQADVVLIAPATANTVAKCAHGLADNIVTTTALATEAPVVLAPAMESHMWDHPATQQNIDTLQKRGVNIIKPGEGDLASGSVGVGRLVSPDTIVDTTKYILSRAGTLAGKRIVVTNGP
jgi:phosphopantothenoylcysteine decarboxylase / phosphopantothenate---cysteine ligase